MKKNLAILIALTLVFVGCGSNEVEKQTSNKVISLAPSITENIIGMNLQNQLIAVDTYSLDKEVKDLPKIDAMVVNAEEIIALKPTHILVADYNYIGDKKSTYDVFSEQGIEIIPISSGTTIQSIYDGINEIGQALGNEEQGKKLIYDTKEKVKEIQNTYSNYETKTVYMEIAPAPEIYAVSSNSFLNEMIELVGGENIFKDNKDGYFSPSVENIIEKNPEVIITNVSYIDNPLDEIKSRSGFDKIQAVKNNDVYLVDTDSTSRASYKFTKGLEEIAKSIHG